MKIEIREITQKELKSFLKFKIELYKDSQYAVPTLYLDDLATLSKKNPAFEFCEAVYYMAFVDGKAVGRIAGIINHRANETWDRKSVRFSYYDFIDDTAISAALMDKVVEWGKNKGMNEIIGPLGFTDMDKEGMLIEGFDQLSTMITDYSYPYYPKHVEDMGFQKDADWVEYKIFVPDAVPEKHLRIAEIVQKKYNIRTLKFKSAKTLIKEGWARKVFGLLNDAYAPLYGFSKLTEKQIDYYVEMFIPMLRMEYISLLTNDKDELLGFGITMPSMSTALQKAKGSLFPFGFIHVLKALKCKHEVVDLLIVAVHPSYQGKGLNAIIFADLIPRFIKNGVKYAESNPELELNSKVQAQWEYFDTQNHKRRRAFKKSI